MTTDASAPAPTPPLMPVLDELRSGPPTVSVGRAAELLGISRAYAYQRIKPGDMPVVRLGVRRVRISALWLLRTLSGESGAA